MLTAYFFVLVLYLLSSSSCVSGSEELNAADLLVLESLWNTQLEVDAQREEANCSNNLNEDTRIMWKEAGHGRCPRWVADNPILVRCLDAIEYTINPEPGLLRVIRPEHITLSTEPAMEETADSSEPGAILEPSNKNENSGKVTPPSDIKQNSKANKNKRNSNYMAFLLLGSNDDFFSAELLRCVSEVAGAFPHVYFVVGNGGRFSMFAFRYTMRGFPSLLLFKDGILQSRFRQDKPKANSFQASIMSLILYSLSSTEKHCAITSSEVVVWLAKHTNQFPSAVARNVSISKNQLDYIYNDWSGKDHVLWLSEIFVALRIVMWMRNKFFT